MSDDDIDRVRDLSTLRRLPPRCEVEILRSQGVEVLDFWSATCPCDHCKTRMRQLNG